MPEVPLKGLVVLVDECDMHLFAETTWQIGRDRNGCPRVRNTRRGVLARVIMNCPKELEVDHRNGDTLDNRRSNLRICTHQQNQWNRKTSLGKSRFKGVTFVKRTRKWIARVEHCGKRRSYGTFSTELQAALAYDAAAVELFGEFASPNFPEKFKAA